MPKCCPCPSIFTSTAEAQAAINFITTRASHVFACYWLPHNLFHTNINALAHRLTLNSQRRREAGIISNFLKAEKNHSLAICYPQYVLHTHFVQFQFSLNRVTALPTMLSLFLEVQTVDQTIYLCPKKYTNVHQCTVTTDKSWVQQLGCLVLTQLAFNGTQF